MAKKNSVEFVLNAIENGVKPREIKGRQEDWTCGAMYLLVERYNLNSRLRYLLSCCSQKKVLFENFFEPCGNDEYHVVTKKVAEKRLRGYWKNHRWGKED